VPFARALVRRCAARRERAGQGRGSRARVAGRGGGAGAVRACRHSGVRHACGARARAVLAAAERVPHRGWQRWRAWGLGGTESCPGCAWLVVLAGVAAAGVVCTAHWPVGVRGDATDVDTPAREPDASCCSGNGSSHQAHCSGCGSSAAAWHCRHSPQARMRPLHGARRPAPASEPSPGRAPWPAADQAAHLVMRLSPGPPAPNKLRGNRLQLAPCPPPNTHPHQPCVTPPPATGTRPLMHAPLPTVQAWRGVRPSPPPPRCCSAGALAQPHQTACRCATFAATGRNRRPCTAQCAAASLATPQHAACSLHPCHGSDAPPHAGHAPQAAHHLRTTGNIWATAN
jgi:hypothetical protein